MVARTAVREASTIEASPRRRRPGRCRRGGLDFDLPEGGPRGTNGIRSVTSLPLTPARRSAVGRASALEPGAPARLDGLNGLDGLNRLYGCRVAHVPAGAHVDGWDGAGLLVLRGAIVISSVAEPPRRGSAIDVLGPGDAFGVELSASPGTVTGLPGGVPAIRHHARALVGATVSLIPGTAIARALTDRLEPAGTLFELIAARTERTERRLVRMLTLPVAERLYAELVGLSNAFGRAVPGGHRIELPLTQDLLAELTGAVRESVNRALRALMAQGLVERSGRRYTVLEP
jgi:CRP-like cAMP-binding protein